MAHGPEAGKRRFLWQTAGYQVRARPSAMVAAGAKHMAGFLHSRYGKSGCWAPPSNASDSSRHAEVHLHSASAHSNTGARINSAGFGTSPAEDHKKQQSFWGAWGPDPGLPREAHSQICCCPAINPGGHVQPFTLVMRMLSNYNSGYILFETGGLPASYTVGTAWHALVSFCALPHALSQWRL